MGGRQRNECAQGGGEGEPGDPLSKQRPEAEWLGALLHQEVNDDETLCRPGKDEQKGQTGAGQPAPGWLEHFARDPQGGKQEGLQPQKEAAQRMGCAASFFECIINYRFNDSPSQP